MLVTKNPAQYLTALKEDTTDALQIGLVFSGRISDNHATALIELGSAIQITQRSIRCMWLRFQVDVDEATMSTFRRFGQMIVGTKAIESMVLEGDGVGLDQISCLQDYLFTNKTLRGINFTSTKLDRYASMLLTGFLAGNSALRVLDLSSNARVDDETINNLLTSLSLGGTQLSTLNICEANFSTVEDLIGDNGSITTAGVQTITTFIAQTPSLVTVCLKMRSLNDEGIRALSTVLREKESKISRLEISGTFGDDGIQSIAEALKTNRSLRTIDIGNTVNMTDSGGRAILGVTSVNLNTWKQIMASNNTLRSVYLKSRPPPSLLSEDVQNAMRSITNLDPIPTLQQKVWQYVDDNIDDLSYTKLEPKHMPHLVAFVTKRGGINTLLRLLSSRNNIPMIFSHPTPERLHMESIMNKIALENATLRALLKSERLFNDSLCKENNSIRSLYEEDIADDETTVATTIVTPLLHEEGQSRRCLCCRRGPFSKLWECFRW